VTLPDEALLAAVVVLRSGAAGALNARVDAGSGVVGGPKAAGEDSRGPAAKERRRQDRWNEVGLAGLEPWHFRGGSLRLAGVAEGKVPLAWPETGRMGSRVTIGEETEVTAGRVFSGMSMVISTTDSHLPTCEIGMARVNLKEKAGVVT
jgi:hypothetical protein